MNIPFFHVDAFTDQIFGGNPAAVCLLEAWLDDGALQSIAAEFNLSETAFLVPLDNESADYHLRWFTPTVEVDLCGHATLAAAYVMFKQKDFKGHTISFSSRSGILPVIREMNNLFLDFPTDSLTALEPPEMLIRGLGVLPKEVYRGRDDFLAIFDDEALVANLRPDLNFIAQVQARGVIISAPSRKVDFVSRFFAPQSGIPEDPVTGSAHTTLIPYWARQLGMNRLSARQMSARGGLLLCEARGERVRIGGKAVLFAKGEIVLS